MLCGLQIRAWSFGEEPLIIAGSRTPNRQAYRLVAIPSSHSNHYFFHFSTFQNVYNADFKSQFNFTNNFVKDKKKTFFELRHPRCVGSITKNFLCITHTVEHSYISPSSTVRIQLHVSASMWAILYSCSKLNHNLKMAHI